jgi:NAD(P)-dependent dehydrogenase (short-subunit alcohol dehydrogenase family)
MTEQRNVILTGAAGGMGARAVHQILDRGGINVIAVDFNDDALAKLTESVGEADRDRLHTISGDISDPDSVKAFVEEAVARWDGLDGVFNIAGIAVGETILECSVESYDRTLNINARGAWLVMKHAIPALLERGGGRIVNTGSHLADRGGLAFSTYSASKHAVVGMTKSVALEFATQDIIANVVCPGGMDTEMIWESFRSIDSENPEKARDEMLEMLPSKRLAQPDELAATGNWLLLDAPFHLSGQVVHVDGAFQSM